MDQRLFTRPAWRDPLLWLWAVALPLSFQAAYVWEERVGNGPDGGGSWTTETFASLMNELGR